MLQKLYYPPIGSNTYGLPAHTADAFTVSRSHDESLVYKLYYKKEDSILSGVLVKTKS